MWQTGKGWDYNNTAKQNNFIKNEIKTREFLKDLFVAEISQLLQKRRHFPFILKTK